MAVGELHKLTSYNFNLQLTCIPPEGKKFPPVSKMRTPLQDPTRRYTRLPVMLVSIQHMPAASGDVYNAFFHHPGTHRAAFRSAASGPVTRSMHRIGCGMHGCIHSPTTQLPPTHCHSTPTTLSMHIPHHSTAYKSSYFTSAYKSPPMSNVFSPVSKRQSIIMHLMPTQ